MKGSDDTGGRKDAAAPRLYTIPPTAPFLHSLARAILAGDLPAQGGAAPGTLELTRTTVLLPTRRACRELRDAFLTAGGGEAALLPRIRPIGDVDEETGFFEAEAGPGGEGALALSEPPAIGALERRLVLTELVLAWRETMARALGPGDAAFPAATPAQASLLAADLIELMDTVDAEQADLSKLAEIVPDQFATHWQLTLDFLRIVTEQWPAVLAERGQSAPYARRNRMMAAETERLAAASDGPPVIAAGSTGSVPATAALLTVVARLPRGAVVLPGLDLDLDAESWDAIAEDHPEHPQAGMRQLLDRMGADRREVAYLPGTAPEPAARARLALISETMRPAGTTERWRQFAESADRARVEETLSGIGVVEAPTARDEAEAISLMLRGVAEAPGKRAALVTPDRELARRVVTRLEEWGLQVDDSAGRPLAKTPPGVFLDLVVEVAHTGLAAVPLMALLKHPLCRLGRPAGAVRRAARLIELAAFRQPIAASGIGEALRGLRRARAETKTGGRHRRLLERFSGADWEAAERLLADLKTAFAPLTGLYDGAAKQPLRSYVEAHATAAGALTRTEAKEAEILWRGDAGEALALLLAELLSAATAGPALEPSDYAEFFRSLFAGQPIRPRQAAHPRIHIWGPLEARLQQPDLVILGGLNEGTWPSPKEVDPWLSRPMRAEIGLPPPERRIGLSAHDVAQLLAAPEVVVTRATRVAGVPTVPSRWLLRLEAVVGMLELGHTLRTRQPWLGWVRLRDEPGEHAPVARPEPRPPVDARPRKLSVTRVEDWIANPYAIYAREILGLVPLDPLAPEPDAALRGEIIHRILHRFTRDHGEALPEDCRGELVAIAKGLMGDYEGFARIAAFWWPQFVRFADWFAASEPERRAGVARVHSEIKGELVLPGPFRDFRLTARADRIDVCEDGQLALYDYKTGAPPTGRHVAELFAPQLPLEAAIAAAGGFEGVEGAAVRDLLYVRASGREPPGEIRSAATTAPAELAETALNALSGLIASFDDPETAYAPLRRPRLEPKYRYDAYAHLARVKAWAGDEGEAA